MVLEGFRTGLKKGEFDMDHVLGIVADWSVEDRKKVAERILEGIPKKGDPDVNPKLAGKENIDVMAEREISHRYREMFWDLYGNVRQIENGLDDSPLQSELDDILDDASGPAQALDYAIDNPRGTKITVEIPEKDRLKREITEILESIKADWAELEPDDWKRDSLDWLGRNMRCAWDLMERLEKIEAGEREEAAKKKILDVWDNGCKFSEIKLDGFSFVMNGGNIVQEAPPHPEDSIPF
jgi:hypothetical protein